MKRLQQLWWDIEEPVMRAVLSLCLIALGLVTLLAVFSIPYIWPSTLYIVVSILAFVAGIYNWFSGPLF